MDELNKIQTYFEGLDYTENQIKSRQNMAEDLLEYVFFMYALLENIETMNILLILSLLNDKYIEIASGYVVIDSYLIAHAEKVSKELIENTINNESAYFKSNDRAISISCNESMFCFNHDEYEKAIQQGKTSKMWQDVRDNRERPTHIKVGGSIVPINEPFVVGESLMMFPKDESLGASAEEIVNCRCTIEYL